MIYIALIALYVLQANGWVIPAGCFVTVWILTVLKTTSDIFTTVLEEFFESALK